MSERIYFDTCCLNRQFDDQSQPRIRAEKEAIDRILALPITLISSDTLLEENASSPDALRREKVDALLAQAAETIATNEAIMKRTRELQQLGFKHMDAQHLATAEAAGADWFFTTDKRFLNCARRHAATVKVPVENPLSWWIRFHQT